jgi:hypothetical protein
MISFTSSTTTTNMLLLVALTILSLASAQSSTLDDREVPVLCNICRSDDRPMLNPSKSFTMANGITWTCKYLQETVQDVDENGWDGERLMCRQAQLQGESGGCECGGPALPNLSDQFSDINPECNLCTGVSGNNNGMVPIGNYDKTVATGVIGTMNCKGLFDAMIDGIISTTLCPTIQQQAGSACCSSSSSDSTDSGTGGGNNISFNNGSGSGSDVATPVATPVAAPVQAPTSVPVAVPVAVPVQAPVQAPVPVPTLTPLDSSDVSVTASPNWNPSTPQYSTATTSSASSSTSAKNLNWQSSSSSTRSSNRSSLSSIRGGSTNADPLP